MPFKSKAQRRKFAELLVQGKISNQTFEEWNRETGAAKLSGARQAERQGESRNEEEAPIRAQGEMIRRPA